MDERRSGAAAPGLQAMPSRRDDGSSRGAQMRVLRYARTVTTDRL